MVFKKKTVQERLRKLIEVVARLEKYPNIERERFLGDVETQWIVERGLMIATACLLDIGTHILAGYYNMYPETYDGVIAGLEEKGLLTSSLRKRLKGLGGFRNILVHEYLEVNPEQVFLVLTRRLVDFTQFAKQINRWLESIS